ncbi:MAG TPA: hypothetical protein VIW67_12780 [Terriglobales bacterium]|jgi:hypothetical protein
MTNTLQQLYDSEINWQISSFYDQGFRWRLGDEGNGFTAAGTARTLKVAVLELIQAAVNEYPNSEFAATYQGPMN